MADILSIYFNAKSVLENNPKLSQAFYHGWLHTKSFYDAVCYMAPLEGIDDHDTEILKLAALYHDTGYITGEPEGHEYMSAAIAHNDLRSFCVPEEDIDQVCKLIVSTSLGHKPIGILEEIMHDADLEYIGRDYYPYVSELLRKEKNVEYAVWKVEQISFMKKHHFLTSSAQTIFDNQKGINLRVLEKQIE